MIIIIIVIMIIVIMITHKGAYCRPAGAHVGGV